MTDNTSSSKPKSFVSSLCRCISWKTNKLISRGHLNTLKWKGFARKSELHTLPTIFSLLIDLYDGKDVYERLEACRINPDYTSKKHERNDLEYYVPQLTNFMVFHEDFANEKLNNFLEDLSKADPYFAHLYYWYLNSLSLAIDEAKGQKVVNNIIQTCSKESQTQLFFRDYEKFYIALEKKLTKQEFDEKIKDIQSGQTKTNVLIKQYKEAKQGGDFSNMELRASDLELRPYISPFLEGNEAYFSNSFTSSLLFFEDLYLVAEAMNSAENKPKFLKRRLKSINKALPSSVYIPFVKDSIRCYAVLNIAIEETKVFSTKERAPFYICLELFKPQEELAHEYTSLFPSEEVEERHREHRKTKKIMTMVKKALSIHKSKSSTYIKMDHSPVAEKKTDEEFRLSKLDHLISSPLTLKQPNELYIPGSTMRELDEHHNTQKIRLHPCGPSEYASNQDIPEEHNEKSVKGESPLHHAASLRLDVKYPRKESDVDNCANAEIFKDAVSSPLTCKLSPYNFATHINTLLKNEANEDKDSPMADFGKGIVVERAASEINLPYIKRENDTFFGEDSKDQADRIKSNSPFRSLKTWKLLPLIVKIGADMKEEQFAVQLISQFDQIFKAEKLKLILTPYEIMSIGSDMGLVEVLTDALTFSNLKEKMYQQNISNLNEFFEKYHGKNVDIARKRFCRSLAAYSLICYFLQIKDRHNGNILLHKQGHILHIDFGFFLSSAPGKGLEFEKKVPFKLLHEYIEVLGGHRSSLFQEFRKLFYKGFMAARKHRDQILILVKMMYSSQGGNLPCFKAGIQAITDLEQRFCPADISEKDLTAYCYNLINQSVDNWRARCYDKYQYYAQGIFY